MTGPTRERDRAQQRLRARTHGENGRQLLADQRLLDAQAAAARMAIDPAGTRPALSTTWASRDLAAMSELRPSCSDCRSDAADQWPTSPDALYDMGQDAPRAIAARIAGDMSGDHVNDER